MTDDTTNDSSTPAKKGAAPVNGRSVADDEWRKTNTLPGLDSKKREWNRPNRKLSYMYPNVILPSWRNRRS